MNLKIKIILMLLILTAGSISAQESFTGDLSADTKTAFARFEETSIVKIVPVQQNKKNIALAGLFSLILPGAGEVYTGEYWKAAAFFALEAAVVTTAIIYDKKGDDQTEVFENYADENWSVVRYAEWLIQHENADPAIITSTDPNLPPWKRVNWKLLNENEHGSHKLPYYGEQQYYELIGKYYQYSSGWNDYTGGANNQLVSPNLLFYSGMRGKANDYYNVASKAVIGIYVNHFLSMLDAVWSAVSFNKNLAVNTRINTEQFAHGVEFIPTINLKFSF